MPLPQSFKPTLIVDGEPGEQFGLQVINGFITALWRSDTGVDWMPTNPFPPKLAAHIDTFMAQNYQILDNSYGLPKPKAQEKAVSDGFNITH